MPQLHLLPFTDAHLADAAALPAERHGRRRDAEPLLPGTDDSHAQGAAVAGAVRDGEAVAHDVGHRHGAAVGAAAWVVRAGPRDTGAGARARRLRRGNAGGLSEMSLTRDFVFVPAP